MQNEGLATLIAYHKGIAWEAEFNARWISLSQTTGTSPSLIEVTIDPAGLAADGYSGAIEFKDTRFTQSDSMEADLVVEARRIMATETGVGFSHFPSKSILERKIALRENLGEALSWSATSDVSWLTVTAAGDTSETLDIVADPAGLAADQLHLAMIELRSDGDLAANVGTIAVGLWVGSAGMARGCV